MNFINVNIHNGVFKIEDKEFRTGKNISGAYTVAIRAEKMTNGSVDIYVKPDIVEMTGGERIIYFYLNGNKCSAKLPLDYPIGENVKLSISVNDMYFFDNKSGEAI